jgi:hypothetical protein
MRVDHLDNRHGSDQKEYDPGGGTDRLPKLRFDERMITGEHRVHGPEQSGPKQCGRTLVDLDGMFERDSHVRRDENYNDCDDQILSLVVFCIVAVMQYCMPSVEKPGKTISRR